MCTFNTVMKEISGISLDTLSVREASGLHDRIVRMGKLDTLQEIHTAIRALGGVVQSLRAKLVKSDFQQGKMRVNEKIQSVLDIIYHTTVEIGHGCRRNTSHSPKVASESYSQIIHALLGLLKELGALCERRPIHFEVIHCGKDASEGHADQTATGRSPHHTVGEIVSLLLSALDGLLQLPLKIETLFWQEAAVNVCFLSGITERKDDFAHRPYNIVERGIDILHRLGKIDAHIIQHAAIRGLCDIIRQPAAPVGVKLRACEVVLVRKKWARNADRHEVARMLFTMLPPQAKTFVETIDRLTKHASPEEVPTIVFNHAYGNFAQLYPEGEEILNAPVRWWCFHAEKHQREIATFTSEFLSICSVNRVVEIPYGIIQSIRIAKGALSFKLLDSPRAYFRGEMPSNAARTSDDPLLLTPSYSCDDAFTVHLEDNAIDRMKRSNFKNWVQDEQKRQCKLKNEYAETACVIYDVTREERHVEPTPSAHVGIASESQRAQRFAHGNARISNSPLDDLFDVEHFIASYSMDSPAESSYVDVMQALSTMRQSAGSVESTPPIVNSTSLPSPQKTPSQNVPKSSVTQQAHMLASETTEKPIQAPNNGIQFPYIQIPNGPRDTRPETIEGHSKMQYLLEQMHSTLAEEVRAKKVEGDRIVDETLHSISAQTTAVRKKLESRRLSMETELDRDIKQMKERNASLRSRMSLAIGKLNSEIADIEGRSRKLDGSIAHSHTEYSRSLESMKELEERKMAALDADVSQSMQVFRAKIDAFLDANDPFTVMTTFLARKQRRLE
ncbi:apolipoprotein A1/A4/E [Perkinsela sp. CCAP 1560/4]|nr:apolipoprotein A1/A4/E [Perkinsela sp. CCAP 1560/4]|eukprot:KNH07274.1 apolipoprotein A1/A4/E [Perkinsela sp. CCAP 1560/4]